MELPKWRDVDTRKSRSVQSFLRVDFIFLENYTELCAIQVDISQIPAIKSARISGGGVYFTLNYEVIMTFGLTELKAQVAWLDTNVRISFLL